MLFSVNLGVDSWGVIGDFKTIDLHVCGTLGWMDLPFRYNALETIKDVLQSQKCN